MLRYILIRLFPSRFTCTWENLFILQHRRRPTVEERVAYFVAEELERS